MISSKERFMKTVELLQPIVTKVQTEKQISPDVDVKLIGDALLTIDEWLAQDPIAKTFKGIPKSEWLVPHWTSCIMQPQKVSAVTDNFEYPNLADRKGYGQSVTVTIDLPHSNRDSDKKKVTLNSFDEPEQLRTAFVRLAGYYKKGIGQEVPLADKTGDACLTDSEVVNNLLSDNCVPQAWNGDIPITLSQPVSQTFGENHCITKFRANKVCQRLVDALQGVTSNSEGN